MSPDPPPLILWRPAHKVPPSALARGCGGGGAGVDIKITGPGSLFGAPALPLARHGGNPEPVGTTAQGVLGVIAHIRGTPRRIWSWSSKPKMMS
jgi:hypothetical protein